MSFDDFCKEIAQRLKESKDNLIRQIVRVIGRQKAVGFLERVIEVQNNGGMKNEQFNGHKTPGGVFIHLVKHCEDFSKEEIKKIFKDEKKYMRNKKQVQNGFSNAMTL